MCVDDNGPMVLLAFHAYVPSFPDAMVYIPSFDGTSYLELRPLSYFRQSPGSSGDLQAAVQNATVTLSVSVKTKETQGSILYSEYKIKVINFRKHLLLTVTDILKRKQ